MTPEEYERLMSKSLLEQNDDAKAAAAARMKSGELLPLNEKIWRDAASLYGVPSFFFGASLTNIEQPARDRIQNWLDLKDSALGLFLHGPPGAGKTSAGVAVLKHHEQQIQSGWPSRTMLFVRVDEVRKSLDRERFAEDPLEQKIHNVSLLVLDDFSVADVTGYRFNAEYLRGLVAHRASHQLITVVTSTVSPEAMGGGNNLWWDQLEIYLAAVSFSGDNRRTAARAKLDNALDKTRKEG